MSTPASFEDLYDFETQFEDAFAAVLKANGISNVFVSRDAERIQTPGVILRFVTGSYDPHQYRMKGTPPRQVAIGFDGTLFVDVVTSRNMDDVKHGPFRGLVRYLLSPAANVISSVNMPCLQLLQLYATGGTPTMLDEKEQDRSGLHYDAKFAIRDSAWPA
jgi:hypothetical protein